MGEIKIRSFTDLIAWRKAHSLVIDIYKISRRFPTDEKFGLTNQIRRATVSVTSNIAEGFSRRTADDKNHFYFHSLASLTEVQNQLIIAKDLSYVTQQSFNLLMEKSIEVNKLINGLLKSSLSKK